MRNPKQEGQLPPDSPEIVIEKKLEQLKAKVKPTVQAFSLFEDGLQRLDDFAKSSFNKAFGDGKSHELATNEAKRAEQAALANLTHAQNKTRDTPEHLITNEGERKKIKEWRPQDLVLASMILLVSLVMMGTTIVNLQVSIAASEEIALTGVNEWKSWLMAMIGSGAVFVVKMLPMVFSRHKHQELAKRCLIGVSILFTFYFLWEFGERFQGVGAELNLSDLFVSDGVDRFVFIQILTELLIASSLFTWLTLIWDRYIPNSRIPNPDYDIARAHEEACQKIYDDALSHLKDETEQWGLYQANKEAFVDELLVLFKKSQLRNQLFSE